MENGVTYQTQNEKLTNPVGTYKEKIYTNNGCSGIKLVI